jgi:hypothetical protein
MRLVRFRLVKCGLHWFENIASKAHPQTLFRRGLNGNSKVTEMFFCLPSQAWIVTHMKMMRTEPDSFGFVEAASGKLWGNSNSRMEMPSFAAQDVYEVRPGMTGTASI